MTNRFALRGLVTTFALVQAACCAAQDAPSPPAQPIQPAKPVAPVPPAPRAPDDFASDARRMYFKLRPGGRTKTAPGPYLGISVSPVTPALRAQLKLEPGVGLVVEHVDKDSPAAAGGVQQYDILQQLNDQLLIDSQQFGVLVRMLKAGDETRLSLLRNGQPRTLTVKPVIKDVPVATTGAWVTIPGGNFELPNEEIAIEESKEPFDTAMRTIRSSSGSFKYQDKGMTLQLTNKDGNRTLVAKDSAGKTLFSGPIDTDEERKGIPPEVATKLKEMDVSPDPKPHENPEAR